MKPYHQTPIEECGEPLLPIPLDQFAIEQPHPYEKLGAPYSEQSPYRLRQGVLKRLIAAQEQLEQLRPGWRIQVFDAYRPIAVQAFMVDYTFEQTVQTQGVTPDTLTPAQRQAVIEQVYQFWAVPSRNPLTPPPHSTGAAVDVTLVDAAGQGVEMGSAIDELSPRSHPDYYANWVPSEHSAASTFHQNRRLLQAVMTSAGFCQHPHEWWHFSWGDQMWAWLSGVSARYGAI
jgi:D-alanyl-D-alanine dipeptidase